MKPIPEDERRFYSGGNFSVLALVCLVCTAAGTAAFLYSVLDGHAQRGFQIFLSNYVFWTGLAFGSLFLLSMMNLTNAMWIRPFKRLAEAPAAFLPISWLLFWLIYWGRKHLFPWIGSPVPQKALYLNVPFFFEREGGLTLLLILSALAMVYFSLKGDIEIVRNGEIPEEKRARLWKAQFRASVVYTGLYVVIMTIISWDLVMSLSPKWVSTLLGPYFFTGCLYTAIAALACTAGLAFYKTPLGRHVKPEHFHSLGMTLFGFLMVFGDFFFSQYLLIWYGNKPEETKFLITRFRFAPWEGISIAAGVLTLLFPFVVLLSREVKFKPYALAGVALLIVMGMWLEKYVLIVPSLWHSAGAPLGWIEALVSLGFPGLMGLCMLIFLRAYPLLPLSDPLLSKSFTELGKR